METTLFGRRMSVDLKNQLAQKHPLGTNGHFPTRRQTIIHTIGLTVKVE
jgi:hypothetical protein